ncbi:glucokinase [Haliea sp. E1-2-M8]|uniref:glucokinase n=1 Tax=Haliea sp. E1-2-M8 TaxID=3064706 RepID=UPI002719C508|nr:glucokinase [Haliea sp. E1-2-M8]MDO8860253.1 glucokinase [Haliea sp. E1-2-M8]
MSRVPERSGRLVADVGGTNTRIALFDPTEPRLLAVTRYRNGDFTGLEAVVTRWLDDFPEARPLEACIAVAAPPAGDFARMSNCNWSFRGSELAARFGWNRVRLLNDFQANAFALPWLQPGDCYEIHPGTTLYPRLAVLGPGTGLGGAVLDTSAQPHRAVPCEPGHMALAPQGLLELELWRVLMHQHGRIYTELLLSGPGLGRIYQALALVQGTTAEPLQSEEISTRALSGADALCTATLHRFCALLGVASADFILASGAFGGLFLAGGILPTFPEFLQLSDFHPRFTDRGPMHGHLERMPVRVITHAQPGLLGAAHAPLA